MAMSATVGSSWPTPTYTLTSALNVSEGNGITFTINGSNIVDGTYYWTINNITTTGADFLANSGSFIITNNTGSFVVTANADLLTEGLESFSPSIRYGNINGPILRTGSPITILDTSLTPPQEVMFVAGGNLDGQLGLNNRVNRSSPVQLGSGNTWLTISNSGAYNGSTVAVKRNGTLWAWGQNEAGHLGLNNRVNRSSPVQVGALTNWESATVGDRGLTAIKTNGTLWICGGDGYDYSIPGNRYRSSPIQLGTDTNWSRVVGNDDQWGGFMALKTDGTLWGSGLNGDGVLGLNDRNYRSRPVQIGNDLWLDASFTQYNEAAGIKYNGTLWTWGRNGFGSLGLNLGGGAGYALQKWRSSPTQVGTLTNWSTVRAGSSAAAIKTNGTLWNWGYYRGLAINFKTNGIDAPENHASSPIQIGTETNWLSVSNSNGKNDSFRALKTDGTLWAWGMQSFGLLGLNRDNMSYPGNTPSPPYGMVSSPVQVGTSNTWNKLHDAVIFAASRMI